MQCWRSESQIRPRRVHDLSVVRLRATRYGGQDGGQPSRCSNELAGLPTEARSGARRAKVGDVFIDSSRLHSSAPQSTAFVGTGSELAVQPAGGLIPLRSPRPYSAERSSARRPPRRTARRSRPDLISGMGSALCHLADRCKVSNVSRGRASWKSFSPL